MNIWDYNFSYNGQAVLFNLFLFVFAIYKYKGAYAGSLSARQSYWSVFILLVLSATFAYGEADFYHYQFHYDMMKHYDIQSLSEPVYMWIAKALPDNYFVWRFSIWASSAALMIFSLKMVEANVCCAGLMLPLYFWGQFSLTRGALGFAIIVFFITLALGCGGKKRLFFLVPILLSIFFHNSISVFLLLLLVAFIVPFNAKTLKFSLLVFPILYLSVMAFSKYFLEMNVLNAETEQLAEKYIERADSKLNIGGIVFDMLNFAGQLLMLYVTIKYTLTHKEHSNKAILLLLKYGYLLVYISFLFYGQSTSSFISSRFLHASTFPLVIVYSDYLTFHRTNKSDRFALLLLGGYSLYHILYHMYKWW